MRNIPVFQRAVRGLRIKRYVNPFRFRERRHQDAFPRQSCSFRTIRQKPRNGLTLRSSRRRCASSEIGPILCAIMCSRHSRSTTAARLNASVGWPERFLNGIRILGCGLAQLLSGRAPHARRCPNKPPTPPPHAAPADYHPTRPDHLPLAPPAFVLNACRPTCASSRRRFASSEIAAFSCAILILRAFPILDRRRG